MLQCSFHFILPFKKLRLAHMYLSHSVLTSICEVVQAERELLELSSELYG